MNNLYLSTISVFITLIFFKSGITRLNKNQNIKASVSFLKTFTPFNKFNNNFNYIIIVVSSLIETIAPLLILLSIIFPSFYFVGKYAVYLLAFFILCTMVFIHNPVKKRERMNFLKNLSMLGGVLLLEQII